MSEAGPADGIAAGLPARGVGIPGPAQALGTQWGLVQNYWVLRKLLINVVAAPVVLLYMQTLRVLADRAGAQQHSPQIPLHP